MMEFTNPNLGCGQIKQVKQQRGCWEWCANITDPGYVHIQHMLFSYLHALVMFRAGTRTCNLQLISDEKTKKKTNFFSLTTIQFIKM